MSKLFTFLNRNLAKILWTTAILVWVGVGIYYFRPAFFSRLLPFIPAPTPSVSLEEVTVGESPLDTEKWSRFGISIYPYNYFVKFPSSLVPQKQEENDPSLVQSTHFILKNNNQDFTIFKIRFYTVALEDILPEGPFLELKDVIMEGRRSKKATSVDNFGDKVITVYIPLSQDGQILVLEGIVFPFSKVGIDCEKTIESIIKSFEIQEQ